MSVFSRLRLQLLSVCSLTLLCVVAPSIVAASLSAQDETNTKDTALPTPSRPVLKSFQEKSSYGVGFDIGSNLAAQEMELNLELVLQGLTDAYQGKEHLLDQEELQAVMTVYMRELENKQIEKWQKLSSDNQKKGQAFLEKNRTAEGITQLKSGLQYKILKEGDGKSPLATDRVKVHVRSSNVDGQELDNSAKAGEPLEIAVGGSPRGWVEALQKMKVGDKWTIYVPTKLAYGANGFPPLVGPNETLIFDIELLEIVK